MEWYAILKILKEIRSCFFKDKEEAYIKLVLLINKLETEEDKMQKYYTREHE